MMKNIGYAGMITIALQVFDCLDFRGVTVHTDVLTLVLGLQFDTSLLPLY